MLCVAAVVALTSFATVTLTRGKGRTIRPKALIASPQGDVNTGRLIEPPWWTDVVFVGRVESSKIQYSRYTSDRFSPGARSASVRFRVLDAIVPSRLPHDIEIEYSDASLIVEDARVTDPIPMRGVEVLVRTKCTPWQCFEFKPRIADAEPALIATWKHFNPPSDSIPRALDPRAHSLQMTVHCW